MTTPKGPCPLCLLQAAAGAFTAALEVFDADHHTTDKVQDLVDQATDAADLDMSVCCDRCNK